MATWRGGAKPAAACRRLSCWRPGSHASTSAALATAPGWTGRCDPMVMAASLCYLVCYLPVSRHRHHPYWHPLDRQVHSHICGCKSVLSRVRLAGSLLDVATRCFAVHLKVAGRLAELRPRQARVPAPGEGHGEAAPGADGAAGERAAPYSCMPNALIAAMSKEDCACALKRLHQACQRRVKGCPDKHCVCCMPRQQQAGWHDTTYSTCVLTVGCISLYCVSGHELRAGPHAASLTPQAECDRAALFHLTCA